LGNRPGRWIKRVITGYKSTILIAKELVEEVDIEPMFRATTRSRRVKRQAGETACNEPTTSPERKKELNFSTVFWILH